MKGDLFSWLLEKLRIEEEERKRRRKEYIERLRTLSDLYKKSKDGKIREEALGLIEKIADDKIMNFDDFTKEVLKLIKEICSSS
ncbi:hypothetical protein [Acidianus sp. HS-5]|uniref:hypothetical protein n=1 Tax=Acidianus sp. HS-5 TaxID=2886040 RepID=UPI001F3E7051|nr:hypothetical protein [Acidianus sp. HS-5]BDC18249.1 hypothetical protein HS5_11390 [Acidianus sp. HS-5]